MMFLQYARVVCQILSDFGRVQIGQSSIASPSVSLKGPNCSSLPLEIADGESSSLNDISMTDDLLMLC